MQHPDYDSSTQEQFGNNHDDFQLQQKFVDILILVNGFGLYLNKMVPKYEYQIIITCNIHVYHKEAAEPYVVPFGSDHPDHVFRNTIDTAIMRAVCYSTTLHRFEEEIRQMTRMFLYNGQVSGIHSRFSFFVCDL
ncbi:unnamed protein product [Rotaria magnacalcarata]|uniref:Helix-turn-helix domain-containing protein n=2 Tax=Rotaria magnacalcarata TaxID=392030 RepID=A0A816YPC2_9BILA|nr:unnamed protein product [Rotaria magnacalcarata]